MNSKKPVEQQWIDETREVLRDVLRRYLQGKISRAETADTVLHGIDFDTVIDTEDELVVSAYWSVRHLVEEEYWTVDAEFQYLLECLEGKREFSQDDRDAAIRSSVPTVNE